MAFEEQAQRLLAIESAGLAAREARGEWTHTVAVLLEDSLSLWNVVERMFARPCAGCRALDCRRGRGCAHSR